MRRDIGSALAGRPVAAVVPPPMAQHTQAMSRTTVLPGTTTLPAVEGRRRAAEPERDGRGGRAFGYALLGIAVIAVFVIAALIARSLIGDSTQQVTVPDVRGLSVADARSALQAEGLTLGGQTEKSDKNVAEGDVIDQSPESGNRIDEGASVSIVVSTGVEETTVPTLVGLSLDQARQALHDAGLELGDSAPKPSDEDRNTVINVSPNEGETVPAGSRVDLTYASGRNKVPDVTGDTESEARQRLEQEGFTLGDSQQEESADAEPGTVLRTSPSAGETVRLGTTITPVVAVAPPPPTPTDTGTPLPTDTATTPPPAG
jgi:eukaryotic-like serine/threonine-protein kinase